MNCLKDAYVTDDEVMLTDEVLARYPLLPCHTAPLRSVINDSERLSEGPDGEKRMAEVLEITTVGFVDHPPLMSSQQNWEDVQSDM